MTKWFVVLFAFLAGFLFCWDVVLLSILDAQEKDLKGCYGTLEQIQKEQDGYKVLERRLN